MSSARRSPSCWRCWPRSVSPRPGAPGFEADDVIGTLAARERRDPVEVVTGDRDLFQLARDEPTPVRVRYIGAGMSKVQLLDTAGVAEKHGIPAGRYPDFAVLRGDPSDGLPGVPGVGDKTAATLISNFGSIEAVIEAVQSEVAETQYGTTGQAHPGAAVPAGGTPGGPGGHRCRT